MSIKNNQILTIFENYASTLSDPLILENGKRRNFDLARDINEKRTEIKKLLKRKVGGEKVYKILERKPTPLLRFEEGLRKFYFNYNGPIYDQCELFRKTLNYEHHVKKRKLNERIQAGSLTYYFLKSQDEQTKNEKIKTNLKQRILTKSHNYSIKLNKELNIDNYKKEKEKGEIKVDDEFFDELYKGKLPNRTYKKEEIEFNTENKEEKDEKDREIKVTFTDQNYLSPKSNSHKSYIKTIESYNTSLLKNSSLIKSNPSNKNRKYKSKIIPSLRITTTYDSLNSKNNNNFKNEYYYKQERNYNTITARSSTNFSSSFKNINHNYSNSYSDKDRLFIEEEKKKAKNIQHKMDIINKKQNKLENKLFKIIDRAKYLKPLSIEFKKDAEAITGMKIKRKANKGKTKDDVVHAIRIENSYAHMGKSKREMMEISDNFAKLDDVVVKKFGNDIKETYWKKTGKKKFEEPLIVQIKREKNEQKLREKFNKTNEKLEKLRYNLYYSISHIKENVKNENNNYE